MIKKEGVIQTKITSKPSFKNLVVLQNQKIPSRSKSKSKNTSQKKKISEVPNKSPKKLIPRTNLDNNAMPYVSEHTSQVSISEERNYQNIQSEVNRSSVSKVSTTSKKSKNCQQSMKKIILMKNKVVQIQKYITDQQKLIQSKQKEQTPKIDNNKGGKVDQKILQFGSQLKIKQNRINQCFKQFKQELARMQGNYCKKFEQLQKNQIDQKTLYKDNMSLFKQPAKMGPRMDGLQQKIRQFQSLLY